MRKAKSITIELILPFCWISMLSLRLNQWARSWCTNLLIIRHSFAHRLLFFWCALDVINLNHQYRGINNHCMSNVCVGFELMSCSKNCRSPSFGAWISSILDNLMKFNAHFSIFCWDLLVVSQSKRSQYATKSIHEYVWINGKEMSFTRFRLGQCDSGQILFFGHHSIAFYDWLFFFHIVYWTFQECRCWRKWEEEWQKEKKQSHTGWLLCVFAAFIRAKKKKMFKQMKYLMRRRHLS